MNKFIANIATKITLVKDQMSPSSLPSRGRGRPRSEPDVGLQQRLRLALGARSQNSVAKAAGLSEGLLRGYLKEGIRPGSDKLTRLAAVLGVSLEWLATGNGPAPARTPLESYFLAENLVSVPIFPAQLGAGVARVAPIAEAEPLGRHVIPAGTARQLAPNPSALVALRVQGRSMEPLIPDGHIAIVDTSRTLIRPRGGVYAVRIEDELMIKTVRWDKDRLVLSSDNPDFPDRVIDPPDAERVQVLGFVPAWFAPEITVGLQD